MAPLSSERRAAASTSTAQTFGQFEKILDQKNEKLQKRWENKGKDASSVFPLVSAFVFLYKI